MSGARLPPGVPVILFDGVCGLCHRLVAFVLARDHKDLFRFASLQGVLAREVLGRHGKDPSDVDTVYVIVDDGLGHQTLRLKARAILHILEGLGGPWALARVLGVLPTALLDMAYDVVARYRYRLFGRFDHCPLPGPGQEDKFISA